jgi:ribosomal protein L16 Arg81 hydroxylase
MHAAPASLEDILAPISRERFLSEQWDKTMLHQTGTPGRFAALLSWDELNAILEWNPPPQPQLRLFQENQMVDLRRYIDGKVGELRLNAGGLVTALAQGATMVLDAVEEVAPRVGALAEALKDAFQGPVNANLYAGWRRQSGFDVHWDAQEVFVLQLSGRKHWKVFRPTRPHPLREDFEETPKPGPDDKAVFDGILNDGDFLYLPRGWWHTAFPLDEPSLHITFGAMPPNSADFLRWWMQRLLRHPEVRANLPLQSDTSSRRILVGKLLKLMEGEDDPLGGFLLAHRSGRLAKPRLRLPMAPMEQNRPLTMATRIRLASAHCLFIEPEPDGRGTLSASGKRWILRAELVPVLKGLSSEKSVPLQDLCVGLPQDAIATLMHALETLSGLGVIFKEST